MHKQHENPPSILKTWCLWLSRNTDFESGRTAETWLKSRNNVDYSASCSTLHRYFFKSIKSWKKSQEEAGLGNLNKAHQAGEVDHTGYNASVGKFAFIMAGSTSESIIGTREMQ